MNSIGERLRQERLRRGFDLEQVADATKINVNLLEAIEADDLEKLPGIFFTRSFVRQYARALDLDESEFSSELDRLAGCEEVPTHENEPVARGEIAVPPVATAKNAVGMGRSLGAAAAFLLIVAACSAIFVLWQNMRDRKTAASAPAAVQETPATSAPPAPAASVQQAPAASEPAPPAAEPAPSAKPENETPGEQPAQSGAAPETAPAPPAQQPEPVPGAAEKAAEAAAASAPVRVEIRALQAVWLRVAADGQYLFSQTLAPGQSRVVGANQLVQLRTGNAGGLDVLWNGKPVGAIGPEGQVRNVEFRPDGFRILAPLPAKPPAPPDDAL